MGNTLVVGGLIYLVAFVLYLFVRKKPFNSVDVPNHDLPSAPLKSVAQAAALFHAPGYAVAPRKAAIKAAVRGSWDLTLVYEDERGEVTKRIVSPYQLRERSGRSMLFGYCHLRKEDRHFRLDRIRELEVHAAKEATRQKYHCAA